jgi:hypothetical protein
MENPETLAILDTQDIARRQTKLQKHNTTQEKRSNMNPTNNRGCTQLLQKGWQFQDS